MSTRIKWELSLQSESDTESLRHKFLAESQSSPHLYDQNDLDSIRHNDWHLRRFLKEHRSDLDLSFKALVKAMRWRHAFGVRSLRDNYFPKEFFQIGGVLRAGNDLHGSSMIIFRVKVNKRFKEWTNSIKKFIVYQVEREDRRAETTDEIGGVTVVFDCTDAGIANVNIDLLSFIVSIMRDYYPCLLSAVLVVELPWILQWVFKTVQTWLPEEQRNLIHLVGKNELPNFVAPEQTPDFLGGTNPVSFRTNPKNAPTAEEFGEKIGVNRKDVQKFLKYLEPYLNEKIILE